ncbi:Protein STU1 [Colletotrichum sp. SAR 10_86]|nr:Protein STU1 [Colletotrichum sp. SAR 10_65]KAI8174844.1 Protein STU1 [Colletotrichum sp. SAR 10_75]KAI8200201.1 Protein STU1 [Colletotrichum sp. SAR 10_76]KAI8217531.1 Protein STU1 [Colletotrichum sp. SAR 10_86]KAI8218986.1 Protein STU1 [Colletotrichum sp. SAR 10_77]KAJ4995122.1 Protein STU1 [Colletotrichum sp. SAR 10_66]
MAEKITEDQVDDLLKILRSEASIDTKVQHVTGIKSGIKQHNVPDVLIPLIFDGLRTASVSQHAVLVNAGFTALNHLLTRLSRQEPKYIAKEAKHTLPLVIDKLGDQKEKFRSLASQALTTIYSAAPIDVERSVRNVAMIGKNPRAKEAGMHWLLHMHQEQGMQFRAYVPTLMELLEDADGMVRDVAKTTVIELFQNAPGTAKTDLKRQLKNFKVRPAIEQAIVKALAPSSDRPETPHEPAAAPVARPKLAASVSSLASERPVTPAGEKPIEVEPAYVNTKGELDDIFREMMLYFEGRETEQNWLKREESMTKLRKLIAGNVPQDYPDVFMLGLKGLLDGIIKAVNSLRTSLSKEGCSLVQDIAITFGPAMDPLVELLMQTFIKLSAATKKISSQLANTTVDTIISRVTYSSRIMQHVWMACQDKNVQPRTYATGWLKTLLNKEAHHKSHIEHGGGLDMVEKSIKRGLNDANPGVRERMRGTYWVFAQIWPARAEALKDTLEPTAQKLLDKDPNNPNAPKRTETERARPGLGLSKSTMSSTKPSLRETMMAQKKANMANRNLPPRPGSAMANLSPVRPQPAAPSASASTGPAPPAKTTVSGGMSVRPMRPTKKRPEMAARPATAGPYSVRTHDGPSNEAPSPESLRSRTTPKRKTEASPRRAPSRPRPGHAPHASESSVASPVAKSVLSKSVSSPHGASPRTSPAKTKRSQTTTSMPFSSPSGNNEDLTLVVPNLASLRASPPKRAQSEEPMIIDHAAASVEIPLPAERVPEPTPEPTPEPEARVSPTPSLQPAAEIIPENARESPAPPAADEPDEKPDDKPVGAPAEPADNVAQASEPAPQPELELESGTMPVNGLKVFEDPFTEDQPVEKSSPTGPVLEDKPVNEIPTPAPINGEVNGAPETPDKARQTSKLLESGVTRVKAKSLDVHGFRKLQSIIRDGKAVFTDEKFEALLRGLFEYLESPLATLAPEKVQDVKAQILATIKLLLKKERDNFQPHVSRGLESLVETRSAYDSRARIVSGLELLSEELVALGDPHEIVVVMTKQLQGKEDNSVEGSRCLATGLHVLKELLDKRTGFVPSESELAQLAGLAGRCLESTDSGVRMGAVQLCVALHSRIGDGAFWELIKGAKDDPKNLITYYIAKRQRESSVAA